MTRYTIFKYIMCPSESFIDSISECNLPYCRFSLQNFNYESRLGYLKFAYSISGYYNL